MPPQGATQGVNAMHPASEPQPKRSRFWASVRDWAKAVTIALVIVLPIRYFIAEPFVVNGASMDPTFATGQFLIVDRLTYDFSKPQRGDVIVFEYPNDPSTYYIKRIIGLPGETISMKDGVPTIVASGTPAITLDQWYIEAKHVSHDTIAPIHLGQTEYFVMGDNRAQSSDSRVWGPLDARFIIGRPIVRLTPPSLFGILPGKYHETQTK